MTISSETRKAGPVLGNGVAVSFPFAFKVFDATNVKVTLATLASGFQQTLTLNTDYTVTLNGDQNTSPGGSITYNPVSGPITSSYSLTITSQVPNLQGTSLTGGGAFLPNVIENMGDNAIICIQQILEQQSRSLRFPIVDSPLTAELPAAAQRAGRVLGFDVGGNVALYSAASAVTVAANVSFSMPGTGATPRTVQAKMAESAFSPQDFGAFGNGIADDATAFTNLANAAATNGTIRVPHATYNSGGTLYTVNGDFLWINKGYTGGVNILSSAQNNGFLVTTQTSAQTGAVDPTQSRIGISVTATANGSQHADGVRSNLFNYSTNGNGCTAFYAAATSAGTTTNWSASLHGETKHGGGTTIGVNSESQSYEATGSLVGIVINNTTASGTTHSITGAVPADCTNAYGVKIVGGNGSGTGIGGWKYGVYIDTNGMRAGGICIDILTTASVVSHFQTSTSSPATSADILLQGNSTSGIILNGTYTNSAIRMGAGQSVAWENTSNILTNYTSGTGVLGFFTGKTTERVGFVLGATPSMQFNGTKVLGIRDTGWAAMTGTSNKATVYDTATVTLPQLAGRVMAMQAAFTTHGSLGA